MNISASSSMLAHSYAANRSSSPTALPAQPAPAKVEELSESAKERAHEASQGESIDTYA